MNIRNYKLAYEGKYSNIVYHDHELKQCVLTDGRWCIISKENYDDSKDYEYLSKKCDKDFDYKNLKYTKIIYPKDDLKEIDFNLFKNQIAKCMSLYDKSIKRYDDLLHTRVFFKNFDFALSLPIIIIVNQFINDNNDKDFKIYMNKEDATKNIMIECSDVFFTEELINQLIFMPLCSNSSYSHSIVDDNLKDDNDTYNKNIEHLYSWSDMANEFTSRGIPHEVVRNLADITTSMIYNRPIFNTFKFDDWLHQKYGNYESENKSMNDMFKMLFGDDSEKMKYYFGVGNYQPS